jgi:hypothetical protein
MAEMREFSMEVTEMVRVRGELGLPEVLFPVTPTPTPSHHHELSSLVFECVVRLASQEPVLRGHLTLSKNSVLTSLFSHFFQSISRRKITQCLSDCGASIEDAVHEAAMRFRGEPAKHLNVIAGKRREMESVKGDQHDISAPKLGPSTRDEILGAARACVALVRRWREEDGGAELDQKRFNLDWVDEHGENGARYADWMSLRKRATSTLPYFAAEATVRCMMKRRDLDLRAGGQGSGFDAVLAYIGEGFPRAMFVFALCGQRLPLPAACRFEADRRVAMGRGLIERSDDADFWALVASSVARQTDKKRSHAPDHEKVQVTDEVIVQWMRAHADLPFGEVTTWNTMAEELSSSEDGRALLLRYVGSITKEWPIEKIRD